MNREKKSEKLTRLCAHCAGPMPPPAPTGRPRIYCSISCRDRAEYARYEARNAERLQRERAEREAECGSACTTRRSTSTALGVGSVRGDASHDARARSEAGGLGVSIHEYRELEVGERSPNWDEFDRICKTGGWPQTFVGAAT